MKMKLLRFIFNILPGSFTSRHARKPEGLFGKVFMCMFFEEGNAELLNFIETLYTPKPEHTVMDLGFGPGQLFKSIAPKINKMVGVDFSNDMVEKARLKFKTLIQSGRLELKQAGVSELPFQDEAFDQIITCNTIYFWPSPADDIRELYRVMKKSGRLLIGMSTKEQMEPMALDQSVFSLYTLDDVKSLLSQAGFVNVYVEEREGALKTVYCVSGIK